MKHGEFTKLSVSRVFPNITSSMVFKNIVIIIHNNVKSQLPVLYCPTPGTLIDAVLVLNHIQTELFFCLTSPFEPRVNKQDYLKEIVCYYQTISNKAPFHDILKMQKHYTGMPTNTANEMFLT